MKYDDELDERRAHLMGRLEAGQLEQLGPTLAPGLEPGLGQARAMYLRARPEVAASNLFDQEPALDLGAQVEAAQGAELGPAAFGLLRASFGRPIGQPPPAELGQQWTAAQVAIALGESGAERVAQLAALAALLGQPGQTDHLRGASAAALGAGHKQPPPTNSHPLDQWRLVNLLAILLALCITFALMHCALGRAAWRGATKRPYEEEEEEALDGSGSKRRSWPAWSARTQSIRSAWLGRGAESKTCQGQVAGASGARKDLEAAPGKRRASSDSGLASSCALEASGSKEQEAKRGQLQALDLLAKRMLGFLSASQQQDGGAKGAAQGSPDCLSARGELEEAQPERRFRTSTSYIRSLVETLSKAASSSGLERASRAATSSRSDRSDDQPELDELQVQLLAPAPRFQEDEAPEVLLSQMDISAAHLILDYMEKHLIDKERLRREWLELNRRPSGRESSASRAALSEENVAKNCNPKVVPFDRNRVRLGSAKRANPFEQQKSAKRAQARSAPADYINASFIHDDDPHRPTHIIAQGPSSATSAHFWQVSVCAD